MGYNSGFKVLKTLRISRYISRGHNATLQTVYCDVIHDMSLVVGSSLRVSRFIPSPLHVGYVVDGVALGALSASTLIIPCQYHFTSVPYITTNAI